MFSFGFAIVAHSNICMDQHSIVPCSSTWRYVCKRHKIINFGNSPGCLNFYLLWSPAWTWKLVSSWWSLEKIFLRAMIPAIVSATLLITKAFPAMAAKAFKPKGPAIPIALLSLSTSLWHINFDGVCTQELVNALNQSLIESGETAQGTCVSNNWCIISNCILALDKRNSIDQWDCILVENWW